LLRIEAWLICFEPHDNCPIMDPRFGLVMGVRGIHRYIVRVRTLSFPRSIGINPDDYPRYKLTIQCFITTLPWHGDMHNVQSKSTWSCLLLVLLVLLVLKAQP
jgi:hypothetical protein